MNTNEIVPAKESDGESQKNSSEQATSSGGKADNGRGSDAPRRNIPTREDCLHALGQLPGLVAMKILSVSQANAIRSVYTAILNEHHHFEQAHSAQITDDSLLEILRVNPELLARIEPLLTPEQVKWVIREGQNDAQQDA